MRYRLPQPPGQPETITITREPFSDYFVLTLSNGHTEELEVEETREWFRVHGADMGKMETALDHVWNFGRAVVVVKNFRSPESLRHPNAPQI